MQRRAERFDSSRQLDFLADLNLGPSDDEDTEVLEPVREGIAQYASMLPNSSSLESGPVLVPQSDDLPEKDKRASSDSSGLPTSFGGKKTKNRRKKAAQNNHSPSKSKKPAKWADKCMYAELLEMTEDTTMSDFGISPDDSIPDDIDSAWVAVTPVPTGKRCLAITHAASGIAGIGVHAYRSREFEC